MTLQYLYVNQSPQFYGVAATMLPPGFNFSETDWNIICAADENNEAAGVIGFVRDNTDIDIEWLYVKPEFRRKRVATKLIDEVIERTVTFGIFPDIYCEIFLDEDFDEFDEDNPETSLYEFFENNQRFEVFDRTCCMRISPESRAESEKYVLMANNGDVAAKRFFDCNENMQNNFLQKMADMGIFEIDGYERWRNEVLEELCFAEDDGNQIKAAAIARFDSGDVLLDLLFGETPQETLKVLSSFFAAVETYYPDENITMLLANEASENLFLSVIKENYDMKYINIEYVWNYKMK